jgi:hypothetical protein
MKTAKLLISLVLLAIAAKAQTKPATKAKQPAAKTQAPAAVVTAPVTGTPSDAFYEYMVLKHADTPAPEGYGLKPELPIPVGSYVEDLSDQKKISLQLNRFYKALLWADGSQIIWLSRSSSMINNVNIDQFRVTKAGTKDTITLYTDQYSSAPILLPKGFKFYTKEQMFADLSPVVTEMRKYNATPDKYSNADAKNNSFKLLGLMQSIVGLDYLLDKDYLSPLLNDVGVDLDLKAFLVRSYIFHKFEYELTGQPDPMIKANNAMVDDYQAAIKTNNIFAKGNLATYMVKK